jgi:hypothetical protein
MDYCRRRPSYFVSSHQVTANSMETVRMGQGWEATVDEGQRLGLQLENRTGYRVNKL